MTNSNAKAAVSKYSLVRADEEEDSFNNINDGGIPVDADVDAELRCEASSGVITDIEGECGVVGTDREPEFGTPRLDYLIHTTILSDNNFKIGSVQLLDGVVVVKLLKFLCLTAIFIVITFYFVRLPRLGIEHNGTLTIPDLYLYQSNDILSDSVVFFLIARLYRMRGVDHAAWMGLVLLCQVYYCTIQQMDFQKHSMTLYEMHCRWSWSTWAFVLVLVPFIITLILKHVHYAVANRIFVSKLIEMMLCILFFLVPYLSSDYLHLHHWFIGWLLGMQCNFTDCWWSRAAMAWCWGMYINGIAVYGRDPVLTCGSTFYWSNKLRCPYLDCYLDGIQHPINDTSQPPVKPMIPPNWRNCSKDSYHP